MIMKNEEKPLTIAIPTYNRVEKLSRCLQNLFSQQEIENVEIIVSDNASSDGTEDFMLKVCDQHKNVSYYRNKENLDMDGNFLNCFNKATGKYVMLLSDDDFLLTGAVKSILDVIALNPVFIHLNSCTINDEKSMTLDRARFKEVGPRIFDNKNEFLQKIGIYITFLSSLVFRKEYIDAITDKNKYCGTWLLQSNIALRTMRNDGKYIINTYNCLAVTRNYRVGYDLYYVWCKSYRNLLLNTGKEANFNEEVLWNLYRETMENTVLDFIINFRKWCPKDSKKWDKGSLKESIKDLGKLKLKFLTAMYCPSFMLGALQKFRKLSLF